MIRGESQWRKSVCWASLNRVYDLGYFKGNGKGTESH